MESDGRRRGGGGRKIGGLCAMLCAALCASVPLVQVPWDLLGGDARLSYRTLGYVGPPKWSEDRLLSGKWASDLERHLREAGPVVWLLRGLYNEAAFSLGVFDSPLVHRGRNGWMFYRAGMDPDPGIVFGMRDLRIQAFSRLRALLRSAGAELFVVVVPDKDRIYPEMAWRDGRMPELRAGFYDVLMADLEAAGVRHLDARSVLMDARRKDPGTLLYYRMDSHWTPEGAMCLARAVARELETGDLADRLGPRSEDLALDGPMVVPLLPDTVGLCGFRSVMLPVPGMATRFPFPASRLTASLVEPKRYYRLELRGDPKDAGQRLEEARRRSPVALAGTSFSGENGAASLGAALCRVLDDRAIAVGAASRGSMDFLWRLIQRDRGRIRLVIWEVVERGFLDAAWTGA
ncbi:MAG: hypothetical protein Fur0037_25190 [Planctomycetota bacterium]